MKIKLGLFFCLLLLNTSLLYSQNVGIVSEINSKMGYAVFKGELFTERAILEKDLNYDLIVFLHQYYKNKNISSKDISSIGLSFPEIASTEKQLYRDLCKENNINQLLIISKIKYFSPNDAIIIYESLDHELGIEAYVKTKTKALMYGNFRIYLYNLADHSLKDVMNKVYIPHRFKNPVFDEKNYDLINDDVQKLFVEDLEKKLTGKMNRHYIK